MTIASDFFLKTEGGLVASFTKCFDELEKDEPNYFIAGYYFGKGF